MRNMRIGRKVFMLAAVLLALMLVVGATGYVGAQQMYGAMQELGYRQVKAVDLLLNLDRDGYQAMLGLSMGLTASPGKERSDALDTFSSNADQVMKRWTDYKTMMGSEIPTTTVLNFEAQYGSWRKDAVAIGDLIKRGDPDSLKQAASAYVRNDQLYEQMRGNLDKLEQFHDKEIEELQAAALTTKQAMDYTLLGVVGAALFIGIILSFYLSRSIVTPLRRLISALQAITGGDGDLRSRLPEGARDETGEVAAEFNQFVGQVHSIVAEVSRLTGSVAEESERLSSTSGLAAGATGEAGRAVGQMAAGAASQAEAADQARRTTEELRQTVQQIATGAGETAGEVQKAVTLLNEVNSIIDSVARDAADAANGTSQAMEKARSGAQVVEKTIHGMERIREAVGVSAAKIRDLEQLSAKVGEITQLISGIAGQTNLLALNAAIEAARAGEHGRGFAVVAEEVRKLAERSSTSAQEIGSLIAEIQSHTAEAVTAMNAGSAEVADGSRLAADSGRGLKEILEVVAQATEALQSISGAAQVVRRSAGKVAESFDAVAAVTEQNTAATEEMAAGIDQVTSLVERVSGLSQETAATAEEVSASVAELNSAVAEVSDTARGLSESAGSLRMQVERFRV